MYLVILYTFSHINQVSIAMYCIYFTPIYVSDADYIDAFVSLRLSKLY